VRSTGPYGPEVVLVKESTLMRTQRLLCLAALALGALAPTQAHAQGKADKPALVVRVGAIEEVLADARYLAKAAGREEAAKQAEGILKSKTGPKGLEGVDTRKPAGLYGTLKTKLDESQLVALVPISDEKAFLKLLENLDLKAVKGKDGLYTVEVQSIPYPVIFRFANGYLYGTVKVTDKAADLLAAKNLPAPADVLSAGAGSALAVTINLDALPETTKDLADTSIQLSLANAKEKAPPGETEAQKKFREETIDQVGELTKTLLRDATALTLKVNVDRKADDLSLSLDLAAKPGSALAKSISTLGDAQGIGAGLVRADALMSGSLYLALPASLRKSFGATLDEGITKALEAEKDRDKNAAAEVVLNALKATFKEGVLDAGFTLTPAGKDGKANLVAGMRVKDGESIDAALKKALPKLSPAERKNLKMDVAKAGGVSIHQVTSDKVDEAGKKLFGTGPISFALRDDALLFAVGPDALDVIKEAVSAKARGATPLRLELAMARLAPLMADAHKGAPEAAKKAFTEKGSDRVSLTVEAGKALRVKFSTKTQVLTFGSLMDRAEKEKGDKDR